MGTLREKINAVKERVGKVNGYPAREDKDSKGEGCTPHFILCAPRHGELELPLPLGHKAMGRLFLLEFRIWDGCANTT